MFDQTLADLAAAPGRNDRESALDALSDGQLLERFVRDREEAAFATAWTERDLLEANRASLQPSRWSWLWAALLIVLILFGLAAVIDVASGGRLFGGVRSCR